jgi:aryl-alcohol dehydrogenase-like predicted oxidoreductase
MQKRTLGKTARSVGVVGLGAWQLGADWGDVSEQDAMDVLHAAVESGVTFIDTADVYGDGRSEKLIGRLLKDMPEAGLTVATKIGRRADPFTPDSFTKENLKAWIERSRANLGVDTLDLVQLHCPPTAVYSLDGVYDVLDGLVAKKRIAAYGVSVETCAEALTAIARPGVASVQIILNCLRQKPLEHVLPAAFAADVAIIARVPLASGLLSGKYDEKTVFAPDDHRNFNRNGEAFDVGETFAGVPFEAGLQAVRRLAYAIPDDATVAQTALRWIIDQPAVSVVIPGARNPEQARANAAAADLPELSDDVRGMIRRIYDEDVKPLVHDRW